MSWSDLDALDEIVVTMARNKGRASLTAAGVCWGTFLLVLMLGFGDGLERGVLRNTRGGPNNAVHMWGRSTSMAHDGLPKGRRVSFKTGDAEALKQEVPGVLYVCPRSQLGGYRDGTVVRHGQRQGAFQVMGDGPDYRHVQPMLMESGRWINERDLGEHRKVAVLGREVARELYPDDPDPVGSSVEIQGVWFRVVGVFDSPRGDERGDREASTVHVPFATFQRVFHQGDRVGWFALVGDDEVAGETLEAQARAVQLRRHRIHPDDRRSIGSRNAAEEFNRLQVLFGGIRMFTWIVGVATLLSGVIGVSNILLITVRERTKEIGLRRALGATPGSVVAMVMQEAVALTMLAGMVGLIAGVAAVELMRWAVGPDHASIGQPELQPETLLGAAAVLLITGCLAGLLPALRAASIEPVAALRSE
jgi:putative ABC transport system permease protein